MRVRTRQLSGRSCGRLSRKSIRRRNRFPLTIRRPKHLCLPESWFVRTAGILWLPPAKHSAGKTELSSTILLIFAPGLPLCDHSAHGRPGAFLRILRFLTKISAYAPPRLFLAYCEYSLTSQIGRCFREAARVDCNHPLYKRCTRCPANHPKFLRTFSQKGASQHCKFLVPYCMIHTMNGRLSLEV